MCFGSHVYWHQRGNAMGGEEFCGGLARRRLVSQALLALLAFVQRVDLGDGSRDFTRFGA